LAVLTSVDLVLVPGATQALREFSKGDVEGGKFIACVGLGTDDVAGFNNR
jgi:hypothetical protein